jgi:glyoxylase-like metal-dependent hydrolase (beta-lactamase superfamily II)
MANIRGNEVLAGSSAEEPDHGRVNPESIPPAYGTVADGVEIHGGLGNGLTIDLGDGFLQIDTGPSADMGQKMIDGLGKDHRPVKVIAFSHGHLGYNFACGLWLADAKARGYSAPTIVAHDQAAKLIRRFERTEPLMELLMAMQFHNPVPTKPGPLPLTMPDSTFSESYSVLGTDRTVQLFSAPSETPGAIGAWVPDVEVLYAGPSGLPLQPNLGMPLWPSGSDEVWADTLDRLASFDATHLVRQYGPVIHGKSEVREYLSVNARALRYVRAAVIKHLNAGHNLNQTIVGMQYPKTIFDHPYLSTGYSDHGDTVRQVWHSITGWWSRNPTHLVEIPEEDVASAVRTAISDPQTVLDTARNLQASGSGELALHVVDLLALAPGDEDVVVQARALKVELCRSLAEASDDFSCSSLYTSSADIIENPPGVPTGVR